MDTAQIAPATPADVAEMDRLLAELATFVGEPKAYGANRESLLRHGFGTRQVFHTLLARVGSRAEGLVNYFPDYSTWRGMPGVYVLDLYVTASFRGSGLGKRLLAETMRRAGTDWEAGYVRLTVHGHNEDAIRFYRSLGFKTAEEDRLMVASREGLQL